MIGKRFKLTRLFRRLGASDPKAWADSQIDEGISQLHRFLFLRQAWSHIVHEDDTSWVQAEIDSAQQNPDAPYAGVGHAAKRCLEKGVSPQDLTDIVRGTQAELLFQLCYMLEDPMFGEEELDDVGWCLVEANGDGEPNGPPIESLHESVLEMDPTGREMRPRKT